MIGMTVSLLSTLYDIALSKRRASLLTPEYSPMTTGTSMDTAALHNPLIANRANLRVDLPARTAQRTAKR